MLDAWLRELGKACEMYAEARRLQEAAELEEMQTGNSVVPPAVPTQTEEVLAATTATALSSDVSSIMEPAARSEDSLSLIASDTKNMSGNSHVEDSTSLC
jgi:hypothetical protein